MIMISDNIISDENLNPICCDGCRYCDIGLRGENRFVEKCKMVSVCFFCALDDETRGCILLHTASL